MSWPPAPADFAAAVGLSIRESYERNGFLTPAAFVFATRNPDTGQRVEPTLLTFVLTGRASTFASQLRGLAREIDATMLMQAYEVRMNGALSEQPARGFERLQDDSDAKDYVVMFLEESRSAITLAWLAPVYAQGGGLGAFGQVPVGRVEGWLTAVLTVVS